MTKGNRLLLVALFISPLGLAAQGLPGDWKMSALDQTGNPVPTTLNFTENGTYRIDYGADGTVETQGTYTLDQNEGLLSRRAA